jgi:hypothetical protein
MRGAHGVEAGAPEVGGPAHRHQPDPVPSGSCHGIVHGLGRRPQAQGASGVDDRAGAQVGEGLWCGAGVAAARLQQRQVEPGEVEHAVRVQPGQVAVTQRVRGEPGPRVRDAVAGEQAGE